MRVDRVGRPPRVNDPSLQQWLDQVYDAINGIPAMSSFSGDPNTSGVTALAGTLGFDLNSVSTLFVWVNTSGTTNSWASIHYG